MSEKDFWYSEPVKDSKANYEYRHVRILNKEVASLVPATHLLTETEWRNLGVQMSTGWVNYMKHNPEPHMLMFRRSIPR